jgi:hypothetical protein
VSVGVSLLLYLCKVSRPSLVEYAFNQDGHLAEASGTYIVRHRGHHRLGESLPSQPQESQRFHTQHLEASPSLFSAPTRQ